MYNETRILPLPLSTRLEIWKTIYRDLHAHKKLRWDNKEEFEKGCKSSYGEERYEDLLDHLRLAHNSISTEGKKISISNRFDESIKDTMRAFP